MKIAVVGVNSHLSQKGGAERLLTGLQKAINIYSNHKAEVITIPVDEREWKTTLKGYYDFFKMDLSRYDMVISTKGPSYMVQHHNHISYLVHRMRVFYDFYRDVGLKDYFLENPFSSLNTVYKRKCIHLLDSYALSPKRIKKQFAIGKTIQHRLRKWGGLQSKVLHPPPVLNRFQAGSYDYLLAVSRLHEWKRFDLIIRSMTYVKQTIKLKIVGSGEPEYVNFLKGIASKDSRIEFIENVNDKDLIELYANALAVLFTPIREDYGYITLEAMLSKKPVITCFDSGEPTEFVRNFKTGFVANPEPEEIGRYMNYFIEEPYEAVRMGESGYQVVKNITWEEAIKELLSEETNKY